MVVNKMGGRAWRLVCIYIYTCVDTCMSMYECSTVHVQCTGIYMYVNGLNWLWNKV